METATTGTAIDWRPSRHPIATALAAVGALPACFALTASYTDETAFLDIDHVKAGIYPYLGAGGPMTGMLICLAVIALEILRIRGVRALEGARDVKRNVTRARLVRGARIDAGPHADNPAA